MTLPAAVLLGTLLRQFRHAAGLSLPDVAYLSRDGWRLYAAAVGVWELGERVPRLASLLRLLSVLDAPEGARWEARRLRVLAHHERETARRAGIAEANRRQWAAGARKTGKLPARRGCRWAKEAA